MQRALATTSLVESLLLSSKINTRDGASVCHRTLLSVRAIEEAVFLAGMMTVTSHDPMLTPTHCHWSRHSTFRALPLRQLPGIGGRA